MNFKLFRFNLLSGYKTLLLIVMVFILVSCRDRGEKAPDENTAEDMNTLMIYIGSYASGEDPGIFLYEYDEQTGEFNKIQEMDGIENPSFLAVNSEAGFLYAVSETDGYDDKNSGSVSAFSIDSSSGKLSFINRQTTLGAHPCHITLLADGRFVSVANYSGGSIAVLPVAQDGSLQPPSSFMQHQGRGADERRQRAPHAHSVYPHIEDSWVFSADLGIDQVLIYKIDREGNLTPHPSVPSVQMEPGAGPRHLAVHPDGTWIYVINELNSTITRLEFNSNTGEMNVRESVSTLPAGYDGQSYCADIHVHPEGKFLYASNRGHNSIAVFEVTGEGILLPLGHEPVRGEWPRNFNIDPSGRLLFVANQNSGNITVFDIDKETGLLNFTGTEIRLSRPVCIQFLTR